MSEWTKYSVGSYEKKFYDIKLHSGVIMRGCWPNAGYFNNLYGNFDETLVSEYRESALNDMGIPKYEGIENEQP